MTRNIVQIAAQRVRRLFHRRGIDEAAPIEFDALRDLCGLLNNWFWTNGDDAFAILEIYARHLGPLRAAIQIDDELFRAILAIAEHDDYMPLRQLRKRQPHERPVPYRLLYEIQFPSRDGLLHVTPASIAANSKGP